MKKNILTGSFVIIAYTILGILTSYKQLTLLPLALIVIFIISYLTFIKDTSRNYLKTGMLLSLPLPFLSAIVSFYELDFSRSIVYILFTPLSTYLAFLYFKYKKISILIFSVLIFSFVSFILFPNYFSFYYNHDSDKNIKFPEMFFLNNKKEKIYLESNKIIVLDFWTSTCGVCFQEFPIFESAYEKYKKYKNVKFYTVNVPLSIDKFEKTITILDSLGLRSSKLYATSSKEIELKLKFNTFPHLLIIKNGQIRYDGFLENKQSSYFYNIETQIDKLLKEDGENNK